MLAYVGPMLAYVGSMLSHLGGIGWGYVGYLRPMLWISSAIDVEKIFRDNFVRIFPSCKAKTPEKPTFFTSPR